MDGSERAILPHSAAWAPDNFGFLDDTADAARPSIDARLADLRAIKFKRRIFALALIGSDVLACLLAVVVSQYSHDRIVDYGLALTTVAACFPVYFLAALQTGAHNPAVARRPSDSIRSAAIAFLVTAAIFFFALFVAKIGGSVSRLQVGQSLVYCLLFGATGRVLVAHRSKRSLGVQPYADLCIYDEVPFSPNRGKGAIRAAEAGLELNLGKPEMVARLGDLARGMDRVVVHCLPEKREAWSRALKCVDIRSELVMPELTRLMPLDIRYRSGEVSLVLANGPLRWHQRWTKRLFDYGIGSFALVVTAPVMVLIAIAVKLESPGPALFVQERIGLGNRRFNIWKFRTMRADQADPEASVLAKRKDARVTALGSILRRTSLDELPQLFNVIAGRMSLVGPRPHALKALAGDSLYWEVSDDYWFRHSLKPGITGLAQIRGHRGNTFHEDDLRDRLYADLEYVANWSLLGDIRILFQTLAVICHRNAF